MPVKNLIITTWNARGFNSSVPYMRQLLNDSDIVIITEHWLHANRLIRFNEIPSDIAYCAVSSKYASAENYGCVRGQGGVAIMWKQSLQGVTELKNFSHDRIVGVRVQLDQGGVLCIYGVYLPSSGSPEEYDPVVDDLVEIIETREPGSFVIIGGDSNGDIGRMGGPRSSRKPNKRGIVFYGVLEKFDLFACNLCARAKGPVDTFNGPGPHLLIICVYLVRLTID